MLTLFRIATGDNWNGILEVSKSKKNIEILWDCHLGNLLNSSPPIFTIVLRLVNLSVKRLRQGLFQRLASVYNYKEGG